MKISKLLIAIVLSALSFNAFAQKPVQVEGTLVKARLSPVKLFKVKEGQLEEISSTNPAKNGKFGFTFYPEYEGLYMIGTGSSQVQRDNYKFYFKEGDKLALNILDTNYVLVGNLNSKENKVLSQWNNLIFPLVYKSVHFNKIESTFVDFFPQQEKIVAQSKHFLTGKTTGNKKFDKEVKDIMDMDLANLATNFVSTPRAAHPSMEEYSDFYHTLKANQLSANTQKIYNYPFGKRVLASVAFVNSRQDDKKINSSATHLANLVSYITNDTLKGDFVLDAMASIKTQYEYELYNKEYGKYILSASQKQRAFNILTPLLALKTGEAGFDFSYPDKTGKTVTLASLKGKIVLVDLWATWCGPCKAEIPYLKKLEEEMIGKDVAIVSLSIDPLKDKEKWLKMIKDENLGGIQLFAGGPGNEFSKYYKVSGIPRFLIFDKQGKIISVDSPRPSNPALKGLLETELAK